MFDVRETIKVRYHAE